MKWSEDAEDAVSTVPFFVRKRVRKKIEEEAVRQGSTEVTSAHVTESRRRFLKNMDSEVKGYQIETCFGSGGCPNSIAATGRVVSHLETILKRQNLRAFLQEHVQGPLKLHHEFRITIADCPNACSRPQIVDLGIIGARMPAFSHESCTMCDACVGACAEKGITLAEGADRPLLHVDTCVMCGQCVPACPTGCLVPGREGFRILLGGKLGRHPQLGRELPNIYSEEDALALMVQCLEHYKKHGRKGERFGEILNRTGYGFLTAD